MVNLGEHVKIGDHPPGLVPESWKETRSVAVYTVS